MKGAAAGSISLEESGCLGVFVGARVGRTEGNGLKLVVDEVCGRAKLWQVVGGGSGVGYMNCLESLLNATEVFTDIEVRGDTALQGLIS